MAYFIYKSKKIFYREVGEGVPVVFLHGNTASSKMFEPLLPFYQETLKKYFDRNEDYQIIQGVKHHYSDQEVVREILGCA